MMMRRRTFLGSIVALSLPSMARGQAPADAREPPYLHDRLRAAALPDIADRLPKNPRVINLAGMVANSRDLQRPQDEQPRSAERRSQTWSKYIAPESKDSDAVKAKAEETTKK